MAATVYEKENTKRLNQRNECLFSDVFGSRHGLNCRTKNAERKKKKHKIKVLVLFVIERTAPLCCQALERSLATYGRKSEHFLVFLCYCCFARLFLFYYVRYVKANDSTDIQWVTL